MHYEGDIYSPHMAGDDYILQCTIGCSHNQCTFCGMYKSKQYRQRPLAEILADIEMAQQYYGEVEKVFLADGDTLSMDTGSLLAVLDSLYSHFPGLAYVGTYGTARAALEKTQWELDLLSQHGLTEVHLGIESGDRDVLRKICKGVSYEEMVEAGQRIREAKIPLYATIILGLAGRSTQDSEQHARNTAMICNDIQPDYIGALTVMLQPGTPLHQEYLNGIFQTPDDLEILGELRILLQSLELNNSGFTSIHPSNPLYVEGILPADKAHLISMIDQVLVYKNTDLLRSRRQGKV